jgi:hypothetical protein
MAGLDEGTFLNFNENASYSIGQFYLISLILGISDYESIKYFNAGFS